MTASRPARGEETDARLFLPACKAVFHFDPERTASVADISLHIPSHGSFQVLGKRQVDLPGCAPASFDGFEIIVEGWRGEVMRFRAYLDVMTACSNEECPDLTGISVEASLVSGLGRWHR